MERASRQPSHRAHTRQRRPPRPVSGAPRVLSPDPAALAVYHRAVSAESSSPPPIAVPATVEALRAILDRIGQPVFVKDRASRFVLVNEAFAALGGVRPDAMVGRSDFDFFPEEQARAFQRDDRELFATGEPITIETESLTDAAGSVRLLRTVKRPLFAEGTSEVTHVVGVIADITFTKDEERRLRDANEELEQRVRERTALLESAQAQLLRKERIDVLGQLTASLAHQIRNPLAAIATASAILRRKLGEEPDPDIAQAVAAILEEVWNANRIITSLVDYARVKAPIVSPARVDELVERAIAATDPPDTIEIDREIEPDLVVDVDVVQACDAIASVIRNAYEAMPRGGRLTVIVTEDRDEILIAIEDDGPGLTRDVVNNLFEPLVTNKPLTMGLGLSMARLLLENQHGTIRAATQRGGGARFEIRLPASKAPLNTP